MVGMSGAPFQDVYAATPTVVRVGVGVSGEGHGTEV